MYTLYGDGIHDDTKAIQEMIDSGVCQVTLPPPKAHYLISAPLELPSHFRLELPRFAEIRLAPQSNCVMVRNKMVKRPEKHMRESVYQVPKRAHLWGYVDDYAPDAPCTQIEISGGIWNCNNMEQLPNPQRMTEYPVREFYSYGMLFYNVTNLKLSSLTIKDPTTYGVNMEAVSYFTIEDITFDYNKGNPVPLNMDGIHLNGNCHFGLIRNLKGACYDDLVALNAHEGLGGDITNIRIDGLFAKDCHSAVRLLLVKEKVHNIHISNVYGTYYQYCIGVTKYYEGETTGDYDALSFDHIYASKAMPVRKGDFQHPPKVEKCYPLIQVDANTRIKRMTVEHMHRREDTLPRDSIFIGESTRVDRLLLSDITSENHTGLPLILLHNKGNIGFLSMRGMDAGADQVLVNEGEITALNA